MTLQEDDLDERTQHAVARLTEREKQALRLWLDRKTAKEMAIDLGISHYAVEKRLRIARAKLGVSTSIEAARLLEASEGYKRAGAQSPDIEIETAEIHPWFTRKRTMGVIAMTLTATIALVLALQGNSAEPSSVNRTHEDGPEVVHREYDPDQEMVEASLAEIVSITQTTFRHLDVDHSGFLESSESPLIARAGPQPVYRRDEAGRPVPTGETVLQSQEELNADFHRQADRDGDGRVSYPEYHRWSAPQLARQGIPADWKKDMATWLTPES